MDLSLEEVSDLLQISGQEIEMLAGTGSIPFYHVGKQMLFSRDEMERWILEKNPASLSLKEGNLYKGLSRFALSRALYQGISLSFHHEDLKTILQKTSFELSEKHGFDPEVVFQLLWEREQLHSTALGHGIAVPHTRDFYLNKDVVALVRVEPALNRDAPDGIPVSYLFILMASDPRQHLHLLSKIAYLSSCAPFRDMLEDFKPYSEILSWVKAWERS